MLNAGNGLKYFITWHIKRIWRLRLRHHEHELFRGWKESCDGACCRQCVKTVLLFLHKTHVSVLCVREKIKMSVSVCSVQNVLNVFNLLNNQKSKSACCLFSIRRDWEGNGAVHGAESAAAGANGSPQHSVLLLATHAWFDSVLSACIDYLWFGRWAACD